MVMMMRFDEKALTAVLERLPRPLRVALACAERLMPAYDAFSRRGDAVSIEKKLMVALQAAKDGLSTTDVAAKSRLRKERAFYYLKKLQAEKRVRMTGVKSTARWHA